MKKPILGLSVAFALLAATLAVNSCGGGSSAGGGNSGGGGSGGGGGNGGSPVSGVLMWKGDVSGKGLYSNETTLTPANVNVTQFGRQGRFQTDGVLIAQPLYVSHLNIAGGTHNVLVVATEHDSVYALDADNLSDGALWERHYVDTSSGITTMPDNFGGRTTLGGEVGITGTPVINPATGALYFVTALMRNGVAEQWLRSIDVRTGNDFGAGNVKIQASVVGDGVGSANGQIAFDPSIQNQREGLVKTNGSILVAFGSFSDWGVYHGWLMAYDLATLKMQAVFNPTTQYQADDPLGGPSDKGGGGAFWQGGAAPAVDSVGNIYIIAADGSFNAQEGGNNYGDTLLKLKLNGGSFQIVDWFTPFNQLCVDEADLEIGAGGVALLPTDVTNGRNLAAVMNKEGRLFLLDTTNLSKYNPTADQIPQEFMVGAKTCFPDMGDGFAEGPDWNRLYGNAAYWNGNLYAAPSSMPLQQYRFQGGTLNPVPVAHSPTATGLRGGNAVVSANGTQNGIVWFYEKTTAGHGILHAYDANQVSTELWNSDMNSGRDALGTGAGFAVPVVADGHVFTISDTIVSGYGLLQ